MKPVFAINKVNLVKFWTCIQAGGLLCDVMNIPYCGAVGNVGYLRPLRPIF